MKSQVGRRMSQLIVIALSVMMTITMTNPVALYAFADDGSADTSAAVQQQSTGDETADSDAAGEQAEPEQTAGDKQATAQSAGEEAKAAENEDGQAAPANEDKDAPAAAEEMTAEGKEDADADSSPAFKDSQTVDGVKVTVSAEEGVFPEGAALSVEKATKAERKQADKAVDKVRDQERNIAASYTFDIKVLDADGNEVQPKDGKTVDVAFKADELKEDLLTPEVYHIDDSGDKAVAESLDVEEQKGKAVVETDGFSVYRLIFSYSFSQNNNNTTVNISKTYNLDDDSVTIDAILDECEIRGKIFDVKSSDTNILTVSKPRVSKVAKVQLKDGKYEAVTDSEGMPVLINFDQIEQTELQVNEEDIDGEGTVSLEKLKNKAQYPATTASEWTINNVATEDHKGNAILEVTLYGRPTYYIEVMTADKSTGADVGTKTHQVILRHMDGKEVSPSNPARASEVLEVYVTGFSLAERKQLKYSYCNAMDQNMRVSANISFTTTSGGIYTNVKNKNASGFSTPAVGQRFINYYTKNVISGTLEVIVLSSAGDSIGLGDPAYNSSGDFTVAKGKGVQLLSSLVAGSLQADLNDVARSLHPVVLRTGDTSGNLLDELNNKGIAHITACNGDTKPILSSPSTVAGLTIESNSSQTLVRGDEYGKKTVTFTLNKNGCGFHNGLTGEIPFDIYVLNIVTGEQTADGKSIKLNNTNEWCSYTLKKTVDGVTTTIGTYTYAQLQQEDMNNLLPLSGRGTYEVEETVTGINYLADEDKTAVKIKNKSGSDLSVEFTHDHSWSYALKENDPSTIVATCNGGDGCDITTGKELTISAPTDLTYNGNAKAATLSTYNTTAFPDTYTITYKKGSDVVEAGDVKNVGSYTAEVNVGGTTGPTASVDFIIKKATSTVNADGTGLSDKDKPTANTGLVYSGSAQALVNEPTTTPANVDHVEYSVDGGTTWTTTPPAKTNAGNYSVKVKYVGDANHNDVVLTDAIPVNIGKADIDPIPQAVIEGWSYGSAANSPSVTQNPGNAAVTYEYYTKNGEGQYTSIGSTAPTTQGNYAVKATIAESDNYNTVTTAYKDFTIAAQNVDAETISVEGINNKYTYNNSNQAPSPTKVKIGDTELSATDYDVTYKSVNGATLTDVTEAINAGNYQVVITLKGNYSGSKVISFEIEKANASVGTAPVAATGLVYDGNPQNLVSGAVASGGDMVYSLSADGGFTKTVPSQTNAGTYNVYYKVEGDSNHNDSSVAGPIEVKIAKKPIKVTAVNKSSAYKADLADLTYTTDVSPVSGQTLDIGLSTTAKATSNAGEYPITVTPGNGAVNANYEITTEDGTYTITPLNATISVTPGDATYDGQNHSITVSVKDTGDHELTGTSEATVYYSTTKQLTKDNYSTYGSTTNPSFTNAGNNTVYYYVDLPNYTLTNVVDVQSTVNIAKKPLVNSMVAVFNDGTTYTGSEITPQVVVSDKAATITEDDYTISGNEPKTDRSTTGGYTVTVTATADGNYSGTATATWNISPKALTAAMVSVTGNPYTYTGSEIPAQIVVKDGDKTLTAVTDYTIAGIVKETAPGAYAFTVEGAGNYKTDTAIPVPWAIKPATPEVTVVTYNKIKVTNALAGLTYIVDDGTSTVEKSANDDGEIEVEAGKTYTVTAKASGNVLSETSGSVTTPEETPAAPTASAVSTNGARIAGVPSGEQYILTGMQYNLYELDASLNRVDSEHPIVVIATEDGSGNVTVTGGTYNATDKTIRVSDLKPNTMYGVVAIKRAVTGTDSAESDQTNIHTAKTAPGVTAVAVDATEKGGISGADDSMEYRQKTGVDAQGKDIWSPTDGWTKIASADISEGKLTGVDPGTYQVRYAAIKGSGEIILQEASEPKTVEIAPLPPTYNASTPTTVTLTPKANRQYKVYKGTDVVATVSVISESDTLKVLSGSSSAEIKDGKLVIKGLTGSTEYTVKAAVINESGVVLSSESESINFSTGLHNHGDWTYAASGSKITATCNVGAEGECSFTGDTKPTLTINAPANLVYDGNAKEVSITKSYNDNDVWVGEPVAYFDTDADGNKTGAALTTPPKDAGKYIAEVTVGSGTGNKTATASLKFEVTQKALTVDDLKKANDPKAVENLVYKGKPQELVIAPTAPTGYTVEYKFAEEGADKWSTVIPKRTDANETGYTVNYRYKGDPNHVTLEDNSFALTVPIAKADITPTVSVTGWTFGGTANAPVVEGNSGNGNVTYQYQKKGEGNQYTDITGTPTEAGEYRVIATVAATSNYNAGTATSADFTIEKATTSVASVAPENKPTAVGNLKYDGTGKDLVNAPATAPTGYTVEYKFAEEGADKWSTVIPKRTDANETGYTVNYRYKGDANHADLMDDSFALTVPIAKADITPTVSVEGWTYGDAAKDPVVAGNSGNGNVTYQYQKKGEGNQYADITGTPSEAGVYRVIATIAATANYNAGTATSEDFTIEQKALTVDDLKKANDPKAVENLVYKGKPQELVIAPTAPTGYTVEYKFAEEGADKWSTVIPKRTDANETGYTVNYRYKGDPNHVTLEDNSFALTVPIAKADITPTVSVEGWTYGDAAKDPVVAGNSGNGNVTYQYQKKGEGNQYTGITGTPSEAGVYRVIATIAATANYNAGTATSADFTIARKPATSDSIKVSLDADADQKAFTYDGQVHKPNATVKDGEKPLVEGTDFTVTFKDNAGKVIDPVDAGDYTATIEFIGNYTGDPVVMNFKIKKADIAPTVTVEDWTFGQTAKDPVVTGNSGKGDVTYQYQKKGEGNQYADITGNPSEAGVYRVIATVAESANYNGGTATSADFSITSRSISADDITMVFPSDNGTDKLVYNGQEQKPVPTITVPDPSDPKKTITLEYNVDFTVTYPEDSTKAGDKTATVTLKGDYSGSTTATYKINQYPLTVTIHDQTITYGETIDHSDTKYTAGTPVVGQTVLVLLTASTTEATDDGKINATVKVMADTTDVTSNYAITVTPGKLVIKKASLDPTNITAEQKPSQVTEGGLTYTADDQNLVAAPKAENVPANYKVQYKQASEGTDKWSDTIPQGKDAGKYTVQYKYVPTGTNAANYAEVTDESFTVNVTINRASLNQEGVVIAVDPDSYVFDGSAKEPGVTVTLNGVKLPDSDYAVSYKNNDKQGTATVTVTATPDGNCKDSKDATFSITAKQLEQGDVTVSFPSIEAPQDPLVYNGESQKPEPEIVVSGKTLTKGTDYDLVYPQNTTDAGDKTVTVVFKGDYINKTDGQQTAVITGTYSIGQRPLTIKAKDQVISHTGTITEGVGQATATGLVNGHSLVAIVLTPSKTAEQVAGAGDFGNIKPSAAKVVDATGGDVTSNYDITYNEDGKLTIKAEQDTPGTDGIINAQTTTSITINTQPGYEYVLTTSETAPAAEADWSQVESNGYYKETRAEAGTHTFKGLEVGTVYYVHARKAETEPGQDDPGKDPSPSSTVPTSTKPAAPTYAADAYTVDFVAESLTAKEGFEIYDPKANNGQGGWVSKVENFEPGKTVQDDYYKVRVAAEDGVAPSDALAVETPARPATPDAVVEATGVTKTDTSLTVHNTVVGQQYIVLPASSAAPTKADWADADKVKAGNGGDLTFDTAENTAYVIYNRIAPVADKSLASEAAVSEQIKTKAGSQELSKEDKDQLMEDTWSDETADPAKIVVNGTNGYEYLVVPKGTPEGQVDWTKADKCPEAFDENGTKTYTRDSNGAAIQANTDYYILVRKSETGTAMPSNPETVEAYTTKPAHKAGEGYKIKYPAESITADEGYEIRKAGTENEWVTELTGIQPGETYEVRSKKDSPNEGDHESEPTQFTLADRPTAKPVKDSKLTKTEDSVTVNPTVAGQKYIVVAASATAKDIADAWNDPEKVKTSLDDEAITFSGLAPDSGNKIITRVPATETSFKSLDVETEFTTKREAPSFNTDDLIEDQKATTITVNTQKGYEYVLTTSPEPPAEDKWNSDDQKHFFAETRDGEGLTHTFGEAPEEALAAGTQYYVHVRQAATTEPEKEASMPETVGTSTRMDTPKAGEGYVFDYEDEDVSAEEGYLIRTAAVGEDPAGEWVKGPVPFTPGQKFEVKKLGEPAGIADSDPAEFTAPTRPDAPDAATVTEKRDNYVAVSNDPEQEYIILPAKDGGYTDADLEGYFQNGGQFGVGGIVDFTSDANKDNLEGGKDYVIYNRLKAVTEPASKAAIASKIAGPTEVTTKTSAATLDNDEKDQVKDAFNEPESTDKKIVVNGHPGYEYLLVPAGYNATPDDWANASKCTEEGGAFTKTGEGQSAKYTKEFTYTSLGKEDENKLQPNKDYDILVRKSETDTAMPSEPVTVTAYTEQDPPEAGEGYSIDYPNERIEVKSGYEIHATAPEGTEPKDWTTGEKAEDGKYYIPLTPGGTYEVRSKADSPNNGDHESTPTSFTVADRPATPLAVANGSIDTTDTTVNVEQTVVGQEYILVPADSTPEDIEAAWENAKTTADGGAITFENLDPKKDYQLMNRVKATESAPHSNAASNTIGKAPEAPDQGKLVGQAGNDGSIKGVDDTMEYSLDGGDTWTKVPAGKTEITGLSEGDVLVRYAKTKTAPTKPASLAKKVTVAGKAANGQTPVDAKDIKTTQTTSSITVTEPVNGEGSNYEYRIDGGEWQTGNSFEDLQPGTTHKVEVRKAESATSMTSEPTEISVTTTPAAIDADSVETTPTTITIKDPQPNMQYDLKDEDGNTVATVTVDKDGKISSVKPEKKDGDVSQKDNGDITIKGLEPEKTYNLTATKTDNDGNTVSNPSAPTSKTTPKLIPETTPKAPSVEAKSDGTVVINDPDKGTDYVVKDEKGNETIVRVDEDGKVSVTPKDGIKAEAKDGKIILSDLSANKEYSVSAIKPASTPDNRDSEASKPTVVKTAKEAPKGPAQDKLVSDAGNDGSIKGVNDTMEYSTDGGETWTSVPKNSKKIEGLGSGEVFVRYKAVAAKDGKPAQPASEPITVEMKKKSSQSAPTDKPKVKTGDNKIIVKPVDTDREYSIDGGKTWVKPKKGAKELVFDGLTPGNTYTVTSRKAETAKKNASKPGPATKVKVPYSHKKTLAINAGFRVNQKEATVKVKWGSVPGANLYEVFATYCGAYNKYTMVKKTKGNKVHKVTLKKLWGKKINRKKNFKLYVVAYQVKDGKKIMLSKTMTGHIVGNKNYKFTNPKGIKLKTKKITLKLGQTKKVKAKILKVHKGKKFLSDAHAPMYRYASSDPKIVTVDTKGKVKAVGKGKCQVFVFAKNGYAKSVSVTVK